MYILYILYMYILCIYYIYILYMYILYIYYIYILYMGTDKSRNGTGRALTYILCFLPHTLLILLLYYTYSLCHMEQLNHNIIPNTAHYNSKYCTSRVIYKIQSDRDWCSDNSYSRSREVSSFCYCL